MESIIRKVLLKNMEVVKKGPSKKISLKTDVQRKKTSKVVAKSPARMKFGVKTAIKVKPASKSSSNIFGDDAESDDETCSNSSNASSSQASSKSANSLVMGANRIRRTSSPGILPVQNVKSANIDCATGKSIPTILNTQPVSAIPFGPILATSDPASLLPDLSKPPPTSELSTPPPIPDVNKPPPSLNLSRPP